MRRYEEQHEDRGRNFVGEERVSRPLLAQVQGLPVRLLLAHLRRKLDFGAPGQNHHHHRGSLLLE